MRRAVRPVVLVLAPVLALALTADVLAAAPAAAALEPGPVTYVHPVDADVLDPFRAPASRYGPGNRGIEYATEAGDPVGAAGAGVVTFAGQVARTRHVTIAHADGRVTSYSLLDEVAVTVGQQVERGERVGTASGPVHVGLREDDEYVDPALFFGVEVSSVRLVPEDLPGGPRWQRAVDEAARLAMLMRLELGGGWDPFGDAAYLVGAGAARARAIVAELLPVLIDLALALAPFVLAAVAGPVVALVTFGILVPILLGENPVVLHLLREGPLSSLRRLATRTLEWWEQRGTCTPSDVDPPPARGRRVAVLVAGLDSTSDGASIGDLPVAALGYAPGDVVGFSYVGGRVPDAFGASDGVASPDLATVAVAAYDREDSSTDLIERGDHLADLLTEVAAATPGVQVDLYAHSQGGIVARLALAELATRPGGRQVIDELGLVATMGTPHQGADLATMAVALSETGEGALALALADRLLDRSFDPDDATNLEDLAIGSDLLDDLAAGSLPAGPAYLSIAGRGDPVVLADRTRLAGAANVVVGVDGLGAHGDLPGHPEVAREVALARAGMAPTCVGFVDFVVDVTVAEGIHLATTLVGRSVAEWSMHSIVPELAGEHLTSGMLDGGWFELDRPDHDRSDGAWAPAGAAG